MRDTLQVHPCKLFVDILSPKVSHHIARLPLNTGVRRSDINHVRRQAGEESLPPDGLTAGGETQN